MSEDERPIWAHNFNAVDERPGSVNHDSRERTSSMISIVSFHNENVSNYDDGDSDREAAAIHDNRPVTQDDAIINLSLTHSTRLARLRNFLRFTFQWFPRTATVAEKTFWTTMQILIVGFLAFCYAFYLGAFGNRSLVEEQWNETVTAAKNVIWSLRMLEMNILGLLYFRKRHLEKMLTEVILTRRYWKKAKKTINKVSVAVFFCVFLLPVGLKAVQMNLSTWNVKSFKTKTIVLNNSLAILARLLALPIFFAFIHAVYIIFSQIRFFKEQIQKWPEGRTEEARNRFKDIEVMIRDAERSFQPFLVTHLLLLLVLLVPSIISCAERFENIHYKQTSAAKIQTIPENTVILVTNFSSFYQNKEGALFSKLKSLNNNNTHRPQAMSPEEKTDVNGFVKIGCSALGDFLEMFVLYSLPLVFLAKLHKIMTSLPQVVRGLKFSEQTENGYLFQNEQVLDKMVADLSTGRGIQILGMNLTGVKAVLVTLLMPFLTTAIHLLLLHVDLN